MARDTLCVTAYIPDKIIDLNDFGKSFLFPVRTPPLLYHDDTQKLGTLWCHPSSSFLNINQTIVVVFFYDSSVVFVFHLHRVRRACFQTVTARPSQGLPQWLAIAPRAASSLYAWSSARLLLRVSAQHTYSPRAVLSKLPAVPASCTPRALFSFSFFLFSQSAHEKPTGVMTTCTSPALAGGRFLAFMSRMSAFKLLPRAALAPGSQHTT